MHIQVEEFLRFVAVEKGYSPHTVAAYRNDLTQFVTYLVGKGVSSWQELDRIQVMNYVLYLKERRYASSTVARKIAAIKSCLQFQIAAGVLREDLILQVSFFHFIILLSSLSSNGGFPLGGKASPPSSKPGGDGPPVGGTDQVQHTQISARPGLA